jgi:hypothetical protein
MTRAERIELTRLLERLNAELDAEEEARAFRTEASRLNNMRDFYLPRVPDNFYYDPKVFRKLLGIR